MEEGLNRLDGQTDSNQQIKSQNIKPELEIAE